MKDKDSDFPANMAVAGSDEDESHSADDPRGPWVHTYTGKQLHLLNPTPDEICLLDIAHSLSKLCRWRGVTKTFYSVAQHSCLVADQFSLSVESQLWGLLHDAAEAYVGDMPRPVKSLLPGFKKIERKILHTVAKKYGLEIHNEEGPPASVQTADICLLATEKRDLVPNADKHGWGRLADANPLEQIIHPWEPYRARAEWLERVKICLTQKGVVYEDNT